MGTKVAVASMADGYRLVRQGELFLETDERTGRVPSDPPWVLISPILVGRPCLGLYGLVRRWAPSKAPRKSPKLQETSLQAHKSQKDKAPLDRVAILARLRKCRTGTTCDRLEQGLNMSHQTTSARINDLVRMGKIVDSGRRAKTRTGRLAICWKAVEA